MKRILLINLVLVFLIAACAPKRSFEKSDNGIIVELSGDAAKTAKKVKLVVINENIIQVIASPSDTFSTAESLMVVPQSQEKIKWKLIESENELTVATNSLHATLSLVTGEVIFKDTTGAVLLQEQSGGGKFFQPVRVANEQAYIIRQIFESPDDEAFYGLGGHQNGQMNYKGDDVELVQHNIVAVVPFVYSSKNYGILWDNYSITKFGDPRDYQPLNSIKLIDSEGKEGGLTAAYYVKDKIVKKAVEDKIEFEYLETPQLDSFPKDVAQEGKIIWEGSFTSDVDGDHKFLVYSSGYIKIWVDGKLIMDKWRQNWNPWTNKFTTQVKKNEQHTIKIEWISEGGYLAVKHLDPISDEEQTKLSLFSEVADEINYYFIKGNNADEVIHGYRTLTGEAPIVPKWAMGFWQSRERYKNQAEMIDVVKEYRKRNIPIDNIVLDWQYWEDR